ncbi:hypothetical protein AVEN_128924-1 [Araneus ventricosus]|uniref:Uncharacterized protein n=1 Tax=Araneus ventricosus TaxID=182803 RepID=A0A4Y2R504_ARAVE|nr:hypothetical protein AVEN_272057-1 [Araneus ventricosus]GBN70784.1 hypothetical protein AVEN_128924-1 [Araneus ventricosus]
MAAPYNLNPSTSSHSDVPPRLHRFRLQTKDSEYPLHIQIPTPVGVDLWSVSPKGAVVIQLGWISNIPLQFPSFTIAPLHANGVVALQTIPFFSPSI